MLPVWQHIHAFLSDPAFDAVLLLIIIGAEIHAVRHDRLQTGVAKKTYELYRTYFDVTEKRKADWREAQRKSRAAKKERAAAEVTVDTPPETDQPVPPEGEVPPPMAMPEEDGESQS